MPPEGTKARVHFTGEQSRRVASVERLERVAAPALDNGGLDRAVLSASAGEAMA